MTTSLNASSQTLDPSAILGLGLLGAGAAICLGVVLQNPAARNACAHFLRHPEVQGLRDAVTASFRRELAEVVQRCADVAAQALLK